VIQRKAPEIIRRKNEEQTNEEQRTIMKEKKYDLEDRLIDFAVSIIDF
jgi:hypothetical protein